MPLVIIEIRISGRAQSLHVRMIFKVVLDYYIWRHRNLQLWHGIRIGEGVTCANRHPRILHCQQHKVHTADRYNSLLLKLLPVVAPSGNKEG
jgi:hypothetical protein